jgi:hypothetical protein
MIARLLQPLFAAASIGLHSSLAVYSPSANVPKADSTRYRHKPVSRPTLGNKLIKATLSHEALVTVLQA